MKKLLKVMGGILAGLLLLLGILRITGFGPIGDTPGPHNYPGLWLSGEVVTTPVTDWSWVDQRKARTVKVQTNTWYLIPHSVTTYCVTYNGQLYLTSVYPAGVEYPHGRNWNANVARDPHVRIKIDGKLYDRKLVYVTDPSEKAAVLVAKGKKYPEQERILQQSMRWNVFRVVDN